MELLWIVVNPVQHSYDVLIQPPTTPPPKKMRNTMHCQRKHPKNEKHHTTTKENTQKNPQMGTKNCRQPVLHADRDQHFLRQTARLLVSARWKPQTQSSWRAENQAFGYQHHWKRRFPMGFPMDFWWEGFKNGVKHLFAKQDLCGGSLETRNVFASLELNLSAWRTERNILVTADLRLTRPPKAHHTPFQTPRGKGKTCAVWGVVFSFGSWFQMIQTSGKKKKKKSSSRVVQRPHWV